MSFPGASAAALAGLALPLGYFAACAAAALAIAAGSRTQNRRNLAQESALIGTVQVVGFALGFLFLSLYGGVLESLESLLFGSFLGITSGQVVVLLAVALATLAFFAAAGRPLLAGSVDELVARARRRAGARCSRSRSCSCSASPSPPPRKSPASCSCSPCSSLRPPPPSSSRRGSGWGSGSASRIALLVTWLGLALAYYTNYSVGFYVSTLAFAVYLIARARRQFARRPDPGSQPGAAGILA